MDIAYKQNFETFLKYTNEKQVLFDEIAKYISNNSPESLLDIGPGNGQLSIPLSKMVKRYLAIEQNPAFINILLNAGLDVIQATFPIPLNEQFDMILGSHVLAYDKNYEKFIRQAWNHLNTGGALLLIVYRAGHNDWTDLMNQLGQPLAEHNQIVYQDVLAILKSLGNLSITVVESFVQTPSLTEMIKALSFVASDGEAERTTWFLKREALIKPILETKYYQKGIYSFPFQNYFLSTRKV